LDQTFKQFINSQQVLLNTGKLTLHLHKLTQTNRHTCKHMIKDTYRVYDSLKGFKTIIHWKDVIFAVGNSSQLTKW